MMGLGQVDRVRNDQAQAERLVEQDRWGDTPRDGITQDGMIRCSKTFILESRLRDDHTRLVDRKALTFRYIVLFCNF